MARLKVGGSAGSDFDHTPRPIPPRQTTLRLESLVEMLAVAPDGCCHDNPGKLPTGFIVNEIGKIFESGGPDASTASQQLCSLLEDTREDVRWIAWKWLSNTAFPHPAISTALDTFEANPQNAELMKR